MFALGYFTIKDLIHDRWRSLMTIVSLAVVVAGYLLLASLSRAFLTVGKQSQVTDNLVLLSADAIDPMESSLDENVLQIARELAPDRIQRVFPTLFRHMDIGGQILQVRAVPQDEMPAALNLSLLQGAWPSGPQQVVVGEDLARAESWSIGSTVNIYGKDFQVTGLVRAKDNNLSAIWMTYSEGQRLFGMQHGFQVGYLALAPSADPESVRLALQADPRIASYYTVYLENAVSEGYNQLNNNLVALSSIMSVISLLAITFGIYNSTSMSLTERSYEIGLLRVVGFTRGKLRGFLLSRALLLTLGAYGLGWGLLSCYFYYRNLFAPLSFSEAPMNLGLTLSASLIGVGLAIVFAILGVWLTSGRLATMSQLNGSD
jgi:ABC-type antimicrobial peptide transport system permease subunit